MRDPTGRDYKAMVGVFLNRRDSTLNKKKHKTKGPISEYVVGGDARYKTSFEQA